MKIGDYVMAVEVMGAGHKYGVVLAIGPNCICLVDTANAWVCSRKGVEVLNAEKRFGVTMQTWIDHMRRLLGLEGPWDA